MTSCEFPELPSPHGVDHAYSSQFAVTFLHAARPPENQGMLFTAWRIQYRKNIWYTVERLMLRDEQLRVGAWSMHHEFDDTVVVEPAGVFIEDVFGEFEAEIPLVPEGIMRLGGRALHPITYEGYAALLCLPDEMTFEQTAHTLGEMM